jgi:hypothetical protein
MNPRLKSLLTNVNFAYYSSTDLPIAGTDTATGTDTLLKNSMLPPNAERQTFLSLKL